MKKLRIPLILLVLAVVYSTAMRQVGYGHYHCGKVGSERSPQGDFSLGPSGSFLHHTAPTESLLPMVDAPAAPKGQERHTHHAATARTYVRIVAAAIASDRVFAGDQRVAQWRSRLLFPFHCFW